MSTGSCSRNNGGSGGGCSAIFGAPPYQSNPACGSGSRSIPDLALNASVGQNFYFNGTLSGIGGTSIVAPELAGFFAQSAAYMLYIIASAGANACYYPGGTGYSCLPLGNANYLLYFIGNNPTYSYHYPFYDITSGCNSNDVTASRALGYYCAGTGYDLVTGWGSANMLQLA
jgi:kumamolisin